MYLLKKFLLKFIPDTIRNYTLDPFNRRVNNGELKPFPPSFFQFRDSIIINDLLPLVENHNAKSNREENYSSLLDNSDFSKCDERVVEYSWFLWKLLNFNRNCIQLLDVGCVLNNHIIKPYIEKYTDMIWFLNPAVEKVVYDNFGYLVSDIREHNIPESFKFDIVTCFSTLEHVGMDNQRYGGSPAEFNGLIDDPEKFAIQALKKITALVKKKGVLLISIPYGPFEYIYIKNKPEDPIYYTFDKRRLKLLTDSLENFTCNVSIYKVVPGKGWIKTTEDDNNILRHAENCAAASGVALLTAVKNY